jgi:hypothetical protein
LLSNATTIDNALNYIKSKQQTQNKTLSLDSTNNDDDNNNNSSSSNDDGQVTTTKAEGRQTIF